MVLLNCALVGEGSVISIILEEWKTVALLKKTIKEEKPNDFKDVDADKLQLFLAKTDDGAWLPDDDPVALQLEKGEIDDVRKVTTEEQLKATWTIQDVLIANNMTRRRAPKSRQIHVLVVVPEQGTPAPLVSDGGVFDRCSDPFFSKFQTVYQVGDWLEFSSLLPLTRRQKLYIRSSYKVIADQALLNPDGNMVKYAVVTGTPGVGKSVFVYYVMWRLIKDRKRVLLFEGEGNFYFDGTTMFTCKALPDKSNLQFWSPDLWCLVDSLDPTSIPGLPYRRCSVLLASTPRRDCIGEFKKLAPTPDVFYMPLWTKEELATIAPIH
ncbi:hypothetical protein PC123_g26300 [Phytophthora cactorum]|nr:hypothetical protein PC123_g26300 [Phytophthora cactorum]